MFYLDYLAYNNALRQVSVTEKMVLGGGTLAVALCFPQPVTLLSIILLMHAVMLYARIPVRYILQLWLIPLGFLVAGLVSVLLSFSTQPFSAWFLLSIGTLYIGITLEDVFRVQGLLLRSMASLSCLFMLATTTPVAYITAIFSRFSPLRVVMEIALLTYRFIFVFHEALAQIYMAQQSRLGYSGMTQSLYSLGLLAANVGRKSFVTSHELYIALLARNYSNQLIFQYARQPVNFYRLLVILGLLAGLIGTAAIR
ncbi:Cobalt transport protein CbiQ [Sporomusa rhizae]|uniref:cobalt ECF transporter T component CbiQ n=1 Tax=Sporomusa rhizae TaxID=357999 RepID=UPI00352ACF19